jgi:hypothetical protein
MIFPLQSGDVKRAKERLRLAERLMKRGAHTDPQLEEYCNFLQHSEELDNTLGAGAA